MSWRHNLVILVGCGWLSLISASERLIPLKAGSIHREIPKPGPHPLITRPGFQNYISRHDPTSTLLKLEREHPWSLPRQTLTNRKLRILALRLEFQPDCDASSSGTGLFDLRDTLQFLNEESHEFDRAPHDRLFFERHLQALANYYHSVSNTKLQLEWTVYPRGLNDSYRLPRPMSYYGQNGQFESWNESLGELFYDAIVLADTSEPDINFSHYDIIMIFHAGSDWQSDMSGLQNSPDDLPSATIFMAAPYVPVDNGSYVVKSGILLPETTSQDGRIGVINGVLAHEFGHQLGFVDIYSTTDYRPVVGNFSLMDAGNLLSVEIGDKIVHGVLPCYPDPFHRALAGFDTPIVLNESAASIPVLAAEIFEASPKIYQIQINPHEYFLIENRQTNPFQEDIALWLKDGVIAGPVNMNKTLLPAYDYLLPGSGLLIWHVDETIAYLDYITDDLTTTNWNANTLQLDPYHPFLAIEEADGSRDIGIFLNEYGEADDMFTQENNPSFGIATNPQSSSYTGLSSGIEITGISTSQKTMSFDLNFSKLRPTFIHKQSVPLPYFFAYSIDVDQDQNRDLLVIDSNGLIVGFHNLGNYQFQPFHQWKPELFSDTMSILAQIPIKFRPLMAHITSHQNQQLIFYRSDQVLVLQPELEPITMSLSKNGKWETINSLSTPTAGEDIYNQGPAIAVTLKPGDTCQTLIYTVGDDAIRWMNIMKSYGTLELGAGKISGLNYLDTQNGQNLQLLVTTEYGKLLLVEQLTSENPVIRTISLSGQCQPTGQPLAADLDQDGQIEIVIADHCGTLHAVQPDGSYLENFPIYFTGETIQTSPIICDIDRDIRPEIILATNHALHLINYNGTESSNFPIIYNRVNPPTIPPANPVLADLNQDGYQEIILAQTDGKLMVYDYLAQPLYDYSLALDGKLIASPIITSLYSDGTADMILATDLGGLSVVNLGIDTSQATWKMLGNNYGYWPNLEISTESPDPVAFTSIMKTATVHNFPNPTTDNQTSIYYYLYQPAKVTISVLDYSGRRITSIEGTSYSMTENSVPLNLSGLQPDVYLCLVEADYGGVHEKAMFKLVIIR